MRMRQRRVVSSALLVAAVAVSLSGCFPSFPALQAPPQQPAQTDGDEPAPAPAETDPGTADPGATEPGTGEPTVVTSGSYGPVTVDDGAGDTWTYTVEGVVTDVPVVGQLPAGSVAVGIVISATHDDGGTSFSPTCFDIALVADGQSYMYDGTVTAAQNDLYGISEDLASAVAVIAVPEGTDPLHWQITSRYGDDMQDIVYG